MQLFRRLATIVLVWATASSTLLASTPYYVCRCPDGTIKTHFVGFISPDASCCSTNCCAVGTKEKSCCQTGKKKQAAKPINCAQANNAHSGNKEGSPSIAQIPCQKTLVQPDERALCRMEVNAESDVPVALLPVTAASTLDLFGVDYEITLWRIDKGPPPTDLVTTLQRLTI